MTYSDDYAPSTSSFSGDQTGDIFGTPDTVPQSPVAAARVVDTQSGYMVVIKKKEERLALSVKRRIGTPPASHVLLTADESLQLSHVLDDSVKCLASPGDYFPNTLASQSPVNQGRRAARHARKAALDASLLDTADSAPAMAEPATQREEAHSHHGPDWDELNPSSKKRKRKQDDHLDNLTNLEDRSYLDGPPRTLKSMAAKYGAIAIGVVLIACVCIPMILAPSKYLNAAPPAAIDTVQQPDEFKQEAPAATASEEPEPTELNTIDDPTNPLNAKSVDEFTRAYVANMLNFSPKGYRRAQIEAMAAMSPVLMEKYWNETNFPVDIKDLPNEQKNVRIKKVVQEKVADKQLTVTVKGKLAGSGKGSPIALKLQIGVGPKGNLRVRQQTDLSSKK